MSDSIEMRPALRYAPRVQTMVRFLVNQPEFRRFVVRDGADGAQLQHNAVNGIVIAGLLQVWATARSVAPTGLFDGIGVDDIDAIAGVPVFGQAMEKAGWLRQQIGGVLLPNFTEHNPAGRLSYTQEAAQAAEPEPDQPSLFKGMEYPEDFLRFWEAYPKKIGKGAAFKAWRKVRPRKDTLETMLRAIAVQMRSSAWLKDKGQYIPHPATWLNQTRWEDVPEHVRESDTEAIVRRQRERAAELQRQREANGPTLAPKAIREVLARLKGQRVQEAQES
jgi:hypothetical protein